MARRGAYVAIDHVGRRRRRRYLTDAERAALVLELVTAGIADRIMLSSNAIGVAKGQPATDVPFSHVLSAFVPLLQRRRPERRRRRRILVDNPRDLLRCADRASRTTVSTSKVNDVSKVNTVLGPIPAEELGFVAIHEHIGYGMPGSELDTTVVEDPGAALRGDRAEAAARSTSTAAATFVDATGICNGRDIDYYKSLSAQDRRAHRRRAPASSAATPHCRTSPARERGVPRRAVRPRDHRRHRRHREPRPASSRSG